MEGKAVANSVSVRWKRAEGGGDGEEIDVVAAVMIAAKSGGGGDEATEEVGDGGPKEDVETKVWGEDSADRGCDGDLAK